MTNVFLKVNKDLFKLGLNPIEILILAQVMEFNTNTGDCFKSDKALAEDFGVSDKTISRAVNNLVDKGFVSKTTKNVQRGKERHITVNLPIIEAALKGVTTDKLSVVNETITSTKDKLSLAEQTNCPLRNGQNDFIKDKEKDKNIKDNITDDIEKKESQEQGKLGTYENPHLVKRDWLIKMRNSLQECTNGRYIYNNEYYKEFTL